MGTQTDRDGIIGELEALSAKRLTPCLSLVIEETADYLFTLSTSSRLDQKNQDQCYHAFTLLQGASKIITSEIASTISCSFEHYTFPAENDEVAGENEASALSLVPLEDFEDTLAIEKIVRAGTERFWIELESIMLRIASGLAIEPDAIELPVSPRTICSAYRQSLQNIDFPRAFLVDADSAFVRKLLPELASIYRELNEHLASLNLLPNIEEELKQTGSRLLLPKATSRDGHVTPDRQQDADPHSSAAYPQTSTVSDLEIPATDESGLIHSADWVDSFAINTLSHQSQSVAFSRSSPVAQVQPSELIKASGGRTNFTPSRLMPPTRDEKSGARLLQSAENLLSVNPSSTLEIESESLHIAHAVTALRRGELSARYTIDTLIEAIGFTPKAAVYDRLVEAFKISSGLFDYVFDRTSPPSNLLPPLAAMELCFLELSLIDQQFLIDSEHPGRLLIDRVADLVTLLPRGKERHLSGFIEIIGELNQRFDGSPVALRYATTAVTDLSTALIAQQRLNRDRLIARENAADRIDGARANVLATLRRAVGTQKQSSYLVKVIKEGLFDQWVVDVLKGATSQDLEDRISLLIRFMGSESVEPDLSLDLSDLSELFGDVMSQRPSVRAALEDCVNERDQATLEAVNTDAALGASLDLTPAELERRLVQRPRLARAVRAVRKLSVDTWFLHKSGADHRYLQVVWVNRHNTRFVLSDERGVKQRDISILQLAFELGRSLKTLTTLEQLSLVEQTLFSKLSETKDDLSQAFEDGSGDSSNRLLHEIERSLRRARRIGVTESTVSFTSTIDSSREALEAALAENGLTCRTIEKPTASQVCAILISTESALITEIISDLLAQDTVADLVIEPIDPQTIPDASILLDRLLNRKAQPKTEQANETELALVAPKSLDDAIQEAFARLEPIAQEIRLQPVIRVGTAAGSAPESAYLIAGQHSGSDDPSAENQFRQRDIRIATNLIELKEACRLLQIAESTRGTPTHLLLRLCPETCLHPTALDHILTLISEHTVGTSQLSFLVPDSVQIRESITCHRLTNALSSIGCHIVIENYNPARSSSEAIYKLHASDIILETEFWERAAQTEPWATVLPQIIADVHHILGHSVTVRNPLVTHNIESSGVDYIERQSAVAVSPSEFLHHFSDPSSVNA